MHIIFNKIDNFNYLFVPILSLFNFKIFYLELGGEKEKRKKLFFKLKERNIEQLPIKEISNINTDIYIRSTHDPKNIFYKRNEKLINENLINKFLKIFKSKQINKNHIKICFMDFLHSKLNKKNLIFDIWSNENKKKKIIFISFDFWDFCISSNNKNFSKIIIPLIFFQREERKVKKKKFIRKKMSSDYRKKKIALIHHRDFIAGDNLYQKKLFYSDKINSILHPNNLLHLSYYPHEVNLETSSWIYLNSFHISKRKILGKLINIFLKNIFSILSIKNFISWILFFFIYQSYLKYGKILNNFERLKYALIDYDHLCPKGLILALKEKKIEVIATQERFIGIYLKTFYNVIADKYFSCSSHSDKIIKKSKSFSVKKTIPVGQYRAEFFNVIKKEKIPNRILKLKKSKKIIVALGSSLPVEKKYEKLIELEHNELSQKKFIEDILELSNRIKNIHILMRFRNFEWSSRTSFKKILQKVKNNKNISIENNYRLLESYRTCSYADLIIAQRTGLVDECLEFKKKLLFYDYSHNLKNMVFSIPNYVPKRICCKDFDELFNKTKKYLSNKNNFLYKNDKLVIENLYGLKSRKTSAKKLIHNYIEKNCK